MSGNVQAIMLPQENDSTYNKIANVESSYLAADFNGNNIEKMKLWSETSGTMTPLYLARRQLYYLPAFRWFAPLRPVSPEDVFIVPREMKELMAEPPFRLFPPPVKGRRLKRPAVYMSAVKNRRSIPRRPIQNSKLDESSYF